MKIALIRKAFRFHGGAERFAQRFLQELQNQGHELHLFAHRWSLPGAERRGVRSTLPKGAFTFHPVPVLKGLSVLQVLSFALTSAWMIRRQSFDLVFSFERTLIQDIYRAGDGCHRQWLLQRQRYFPSSQTWGDRWNPLHRTILSLERHIYRPSGNCLIITNSQRGKQEIIHHYATPAERIVVIYNGVDLEEFHPRHRIRWRRLSRQKRGIPEEVGVLLFVGSGFQRKGLRYLLSALKYVEQELSRPLILFVVGKGESRAYQRQIEQEQLRSQVVFLGVQSEMQELYAVADLFVLPTLYDPFSNATLEAMASGLPIITSAMNGVSEILEEWQARLVLKNPSAVEDLAARIVSVFPERQMVGEALRTFAERYPLQACVEKTLQVWEGWK